MEEIEKYKNIKGDERVKASFLELFEICQRCRLPKNRKLLIKAFNFAYEAHSNMRRKTGEPFIMHPLEVSKIVVKEIGLGVTSVICALLHDTVEDNDDINLEIIKDRFGERVAEIVDGLTKIPIVNHGELSEQAATFRKMLMSIPQDIRVILIKLADRLHNMRTLDGMSENKQVVKAGETLYVYAPLARRLGLNKIGRELEDLSFKFHSPGDYENLMKLITNSQTERDKIFKEFSDQVSKVLDKSKYVFEIKGIQKSLYATWNRMNEKNVDLREIHNFQSIRLIFKPKPRIPERLQCYNIYTMVTSIFKARDGSLQDWIVNPRSNNFEALIVDVMIGDGNWREIQILSHRMADLAERGYSTEKQIGKDNEPSQRDKWIEGLKSQLVNLKNDDLDFLEDFKLSLYVSEIYAYTPAGKIIKLPKGATVLDFAFHIHSQLGYRCIGAKVNRKLVNITHVLESADQVEILSSENTKPDKEWLNFVISPRAKDSLKFYFRKDDKEVNQRGEEKLKEILSGLGCNDYQSGLTRMMDYFDLEEIDLIQKIGSGLINKKELEKAYKTDQSYGFFGRLFGDFLKSKPVDEQARSHLDFSPKKPYDAIEFVDKQQYELAKCCNPIPGDNAIAYKDETDKITIHLTTCNNAHRLNTEHGMSVAKVAWKPHKIGQYLAKIFIKGIDRKSILHDITYIITEQMSVNMKSINLDGHLGIYEGYIIMYIPNLDVLNALTRKISLIEGVQEVRRITAF
jgi:GTP diphosphokinase / guanosine-3',5'-bis(diphosphate) 3'-diphosphatase